MGMYPAIPSPVMEAFPMKDIRSAVIMDRATVWLILQRVLPNPAIPLFANIGVQLSIPDLQKDLQTAFIEY